MPNSNYISGVRKERLLVNYEREKGNLAFRSAGSHSPVDVCVIDREARLIRFIQCKPENFSKSEEAKLHECFKDEIRPYAVEFLLVKNLKEYKEK